MIDWQSSTSCSVALEIRLDASFVKNTDKDSRGLALDQ